MIGELIPKNKKFLTLTNQRVVKKLVHNIDPPKKHKWHTIMKAI